MENMDLSVLEKFLQQYHIGYESISCTSGPRYSLYKLKPRPGDRVSYIKNLQEDISISLGSPVRIITLEDGIGIEVAHKKEEQELIEYTCLDSTSAGEDELPIMLGVGIDNKVIFEDLTQLPHLLIAGATKQGKTNAVRVMIASLVQNLSPAKLKFVFFDPKQCDLDVCRQLFNKGYIAVEPRYSSKDEEQERCIARTETESLSLLSSLETEMEERYAVLARYSIKNIERYHSRYEAGTLSGQSNRYYPYIVAIIDEFADLTKTSNSLLSRKILAKIVRLAMKGRAVGIHLIIDTQRPCVDVITGTIKANFPSRLAVRTASRIDSLCILDCPGAERLAGMGDALFSEGMDLKRIQIPYLNEEDFTEIVSKIADSDSPYYLPLAENDEQIHCEGTEENIDELFRDAAIMVVALQMASSTMLQRKLSIGFARASRIIEQLEHAGIVGGMRGTGPRKVLVSTLSELNAKLGNQE